MVRAIVSRTFIAYYKTNWRAGPRVFRYMIAGKRLVHLLAICEVISAVVLEQ